MPQVPEEVDKDELKGLQQLTFILVMAARMTRIILEDSSFQNYFANIVPVMYTFVTCAEAG